MKFSGTCGHCKSTIRTSDGGRTWRHEVKPAKVNAHYAYAVGIMIQI
jgi:hypothetical protein